MNKSILFALTTWIALILSPGLVMGGDVLNRDGRSFADIPEEEIEEYEWKEGKVELPPYPEDGDLVEFEVDGGNESFRYFLDEKSLSVGDDEVVRYTLVVRSKTGAENIFFEGMRCGAREYKIYAFGTGKGKLTPYRNPRWQAVRLGGLMRYRLDLLDHYLCRDAFPRQPEQILEAIEGIGSGDTGMGGTKLF